MKIFVVVRRIMRQMEDTMRLILCGGGYGERSRVYERFAREDTVHPFCVYI